METTNHRMVGAATQAAETALGDALLGTYRIPLITISVRSTQLLIILGVCQVTAR
jgi:hypothetical protein